MKYILIFLILILNLTTTFSQQVEEIISKHINAIGGSELWGKVNSISYNGYVKMNGGQKAKILNLLTRSPLANYLEFAWQGMVKKSAFKNGKGWSYSPFNGKRTADPMNEMSIKTSILNSDPQGHLLNYKTDGSSVEYLGLEDVEGNDVYKIRLVTKENDMIYYYIDVQTFFILREDIKVKTKDSENTTNSLFSDFRKTEFGIVLPYFVQGADSEGNGYGSGSFYEKIEVNNKVNDSLFDMPSKF
ncbi:MAG: hypothetical protein IPP65_06900 [Chlorobi bacterium]|nr:hypothetical protein [Chlorobiota bacterium]